MGILGGVPAGLEIRKEDINVDLARRQVGYGRGGRMRIEKDEAEIISGVRWGKTLGSPVGLQIRNRDWENWMEKMSPDPSFADCIPPMTKPRPGHADLTGVLKYGHQDIRFALERASARETATRVALGAVAKKILSFFDIRIGSHVVEIGGIKAKRFPLDKPQHLSVFEEMTESAEKSDLRCADPQSEMKMREKIKEAKKKGDSLGGVFEVIAMGVPIGLGSYSQWDKRLNARLARALMSIQAMKGVEIGLGFQGASRPGSRVHDPIFYDPADRRFYRKTNRAGGMEGGITNGEPIVARVAMKPIATLYSPLASVDIKTKAPFEASVERSDICAVPAAGVVGEAMVALEIADAFMEKFSHDNMAEMRRNYDQYMKYLREY
jgi:chorismate synthase